MLSRFDTIPERDGQTDRHNCSTQYRASALLRAIKIEEVEQECEGQCSGLLSDSKKIVIKIVRGPKYVLSKHHIGLPIGRQ